MLRIVKSSMAHYHFMHYLPHPLVHGPKGYAEVIETLAWGLQQLGHDTSQAVNGIDPQAVNIVFGAHMLQLETLQQLPSNSIVFNMEQMRNRAAEDTNRQMHLIAQRFEVWEYSTANLAAWDELGAVRVKVVPVGYAPVLTRVPKPAVQDIDVLLYGISGVKRLQAVHDLSKRGLATVFVSGLYGRARDNLIARSKLVLNVNLHEYAQIFEIVRVSYLLANRKAVVATKDPLTVAEADIEAAVKFTSAEELTVDCVRLIEDDVERAALEARGFEIFSKRDIRVSLRAALL